MEEKRDVSSHPMVDLDNMIRWGKKMARMFWSGIMEAFASPPRQLVQGSTAEQNGGKGSPVFEKRKGGSRANTAFIHVSIAFGLLVLLLLLLLHGARIVYVRVSGMYGRCARGQL